MNREMRAAKNALSNPDCPFCRSAGRTVEIMDEDENLVMAFIAVDPPHPSRS